MPGYLLDASAFAKTVLLETGSQYVEELVTGAIAGPTRIAVLHIGFVEAVNAIWKRCDRGEMGPDRALEAQARLIGLSEGLNVVQASDRIRRALQIAIAMRITVYDALPLAWAEHQRMTLVTGDRRRAGVAAQLRPPVQVDLLAPDTDERA